MSWGKDKDHMPQWMTPSTQLRWMSPSLQLPACTQIKQQSGHVHPGAGPEGALGLGSLHMCAVASQSFRTHITEDKTCVWRVPAPALAYNRYLVCHILCKFRCQHSWVCFPGPTHLISKSNITASMCVDKSCLWGWISHGFQTQIKEQKVLPKEKKKNRCGFLPSGGRPVLATPRIIGRCVFRTTVEDSLTLMETKKFADALDFLIIFKLIYFPFPDACLSLNTYFNELTWRHWLA